MKMSTYKILVTVAIPLGAISYMKSLRAVGPFILLSIAAILYTTGCDQDEETALEDWEFLGFADKYALKLEIEGDFLYVAAGKAGLWKIDLDEESSPWVYCGLADPALELASSSGVLDVDVVGNEILVAYNDVHLDSTDVGSFSSIDGGTSWARSDSGIASADFPYSYLFSAQRSPLNPDIALAYNGAMFKSTNGGRSWHAQTERGVIAQQLYLKWHSARGNICWFFGSGSFFGPVLGYNDVSADTSRGFDMVKILEFVDNTCFDVTFDATDPDVVYVGTFRQMIKTEDYGDTWIVPLFEHPEGGFFKAVEGHPTIHNLVFFGGGRTLFMSRDGGETQESIETPNDTQIFDMIFDQKRDQLIISTENGVYASPLSY